MDSDDVENYFEDSLLTIFGDVKTSHGEPGEIFTYRTPTSTISVRLFNADTFEERVKLFAHFVWNAGVLAADFIISGTFDVAGESLLELGAGAGLPGIAAVLHGAETVVLSDYDSPALLENLRDNVENNVPATMRSRVHVEAHIWGQSTAAITRYFSRIIVADCFWMLDQHENLIHSLSGLLEHSATARVFMIAGFHTGRAVLAEFFRIAALHSLIPDDDRIEYNVVSGVSRPWEDDRGAEDVIERKQWLVVAKLKWNHKFL